MKKQTIVFIMILSFLVSSRIIYKERYYRTRTIHKIEITQNEYSRYENLNSRGGKHALFIEKEYDYLIGGIISFSLGLLLIGYNHFKKNNPTV